MRRFVVNNSKKRNTGELLKAAKRLDAYKSVQMPTIPVYPGGCLHVHDFTQSLNNHIPIFTNSNNILIWDADVYRAGTSMADMVQILFSLCIIEQYNTE